MSWWYIFVVTLQQKYNHVSKTNKISSLCDTKKVVFCASQFNIIFNYIQFLYFTTVFCICFCCDSYFAVIFLCSVVSFLSSAVSFLHFTVVFFILPWVFSILPWFSLFCRTFSFISREISLFCPHFLYSAVAFFVLPRVFFILPWICLCCRDFHYIAMVLFFLPWQLWAIVHISSMLIFFTEVLERKKLSIHLLLSCLTYRSSF